MIVSAIFYLIDSVPIHNGLYIPYQLAFPCYTSGHTLAEQFHLVAYQVKQRGCGRQLPTMSRLAHVPSK